MQLHPGDDFQAVISGHPAGTVFLVKAGVHREQSVVPRDGDVFIGEPGAFKRTYDRQDFAMPPHSLTVLDNAKSAGLSVYGIGKIEDLFAGQGLTDAVHTEGDRDGLKKTLDAIQNRTERGIIFTNLVDLDMTYGHRENPEGYAEGLKLIDSYLPDLLDALGESRVSSAYDEALLNEILRG